MNILRLSTVALTLAIAVFALGYVNPSFAHKTDEKHNHGGGGEDPPPVEGCTASHCIVSVGKSPRPAVTQYVLASGGSYSVMSSGRFGEILGSFDAITQLCADVDVVIVEWSNPPNMKNLTWTNLEDYMNCGGGIIFEDPRNVEALASDVTTIEINFHVTEDGPIPIYLEPQLFLVPPCAPTVGPPLNNYNCGNYPGAILPVVNQHMTFDEGNSHVNLNSFLRLDNTLGDVVGLYGTFGNGGIVLTGPDNGFHGDCNFNPNQSAEINTARKNHARLLWNEINWLLSIGPAPAVTTDGCGD